MSRSKAIRALHMRLGWLGALLEREADAESARAHGYRQDSAAIRWALGALDVLDHAKVDEYQAVAAAKLAAREAVAT